MSQQTDMDAPEPLAVVLLLSIEGLLDQQQLEKQLKREGLTPIEGEPFTYLGETTTHRINTTLYIQSAVKRAITKAGFGQCKMIFQVGEYPMEAYRYDTQKQEFILADLV